MTQKINDNEETGELKVLVKTDKGIDFVPVEDIFKKKDKKESTPTKSDKKVQIND